MRVGDEEARAAAAVAPAFADCSNEVRLPADVSTELDDFPTARPFGSDAWTEASDDDDDEEEEIACVDTAEVTAVVATGEASVKIVAVITEVVTDIKIDSVFAKGATEATVSVRVSIDTAVTVRVLGRILEAVSLNVEVTAGTATVVVWAAANVEECEPIFEIPPRRDDLLQGVWCRS